jgi:hypothetical protein
MLNKVTILSVIFLLAYSNPHLQAQSPRKLSLSEAVSLGSEATTSFVEDGTC